MRSESLQIYMKGRKAVSRALVPRRTGKRIRRYTDFQKLTVCDWFLLPVSNQDLTSSFMIELMSLTNIKDKILSPMRRKSLIGSVVFGAQANSNKYWTAQKTKRPEFKRQLLWESIEHSPYKGGGESALFPFLVLEAKAEKGNCGFGNTQTQTAFAIQKLLKVQHGLKIATGSESQWGSGPLVWFLAYCGEKWHVAAAYVQAEGNVPHYVSCKFLSVATRIVWHF
jgi:hypothetical protein